MIHIRTHMTLLNQWTVINCISVFPSSGPLRSAAYNLRVALIIRFYPLRWPLDNQGTIQDSIIFWSWWLSGKRELNPRWFLGYPTAMMSYRWSISYYYICVKLRFATWVHKFRVQNVLCTSSICFQIVMLDYIAYRAILAYRQTWCFAAMLYVATKETEFKFAPWVSHLYSNHSSIFIVRPCSVMSTRFHVEHETITFAPHHAFAYTSTKLPIL